jgi:hypothetical protein
MVNSSTIKQSSLASAAFVVRPAGALSKLNAIDEKEVLSQTLLSHFAIGSFEPNN